MDEDKEYLIRIEDGDSKAFDFIFLKYYAKIKNFIFSLIKKEEDAKDLAQSIFLKVWENRSRLSQIDSFKAYLFQMSKNKVFDYYKQNIAFENYLSEQDSKDIRVDLLEEIIDAEDLNRLIDIVINNMPEQRKRVFTMSRKDGLTNEEIATQLNISRRTVETHISKALADLRKFVSIIFILFL